ncbi:MAG TPA: TRAM domain-containing protein, partial [Gammaproteobacteria bacterium]|nr:TRAM domain-containing protein [Gammaproteobacteria bacterium]
MSKRKKIPVGEYKAIITKLSHDGQGIAEIEGKKIFIAHALPQEEVTFAYTYVKRQFAQGKAISVQQPHANRVEPRCEAFARCGGCSLQHMSTEAQIHLKENAVRELFHSVAKVNPKTWLAPLVDASWGYRKKARLGVRLVLQKGGVLIGFREKFSNKIAVI